jgi:hypothetical protein
MTRVDPNGASRRSLSSRTPKAIFLGLREEGAMRPERFGFIRVIRIQQSVAAGETMHVAAGETKRVAARLSTAYSMIARVFDRDARRFDTTSSTSTVTV